MKFNRKNKNSLKTFNNTLLNQMKSKIYCNFLTKAKKAQITIIKNNLIINFHN